MAIGFLGNHRQHVALEAAVADWLQCGGVRLFNAGYAASVGVLTSLLRAGDVVFSDELNHASIIDGCRLSRAEIVVFPHCDLTALEAALVKHGGRRCIVVSVGFGLALIAGRCRSATGRRAARAASRRSSGAGRRDPRSGGGDE